MRKTKSQWEELEKWINSLPESANPYIQINVHGASSKDISAMSETIDDASEDSHEGTRWVEGFVAGFNVYVFRGRDNDE
jgi:hypothetical protein